MKYLLKYSSEITLKSDRTKRRLMHFLYENIKEALSGRLFSIDKRWYGIVLDAGEDEEVLDILRRIFGVEIISPAMEITTTSLDEILNKGLEYCRERVRDRRFAVRCTRAGRHDFSSRDVERRLGALLVEYGKVDLTNPEIACYVEIKNESVFFYTEKIRGQGGFPVGSEGRVLALLSGGIDSAVAVWYAYRLGLDVDFLFFDLGGNQREIALEMARFLRSRWGYGSRGRFHYVDFSRVISEIMKARPSYRNLLLKYAFYRFSDRLAKSMGYDAIITGEAIGQVSTQTLKNLALLNATVDSMVIRPLSAMRKSEIMAKAEEIGTYQLAYKGKEYCAISKKNVETHGKMDKLLGEVEKMDMSILENLDIQTYEYPYEGVEFVHREKSDDLKGRVIVDLRSGGEEIEGAIRIPFEKAVSTFREWDRDKKYLLVCEKGQKSQLLAEMMRDAGFDATYMSEGEFFNLLKESSS